MVTKKQKKMRLKISMKYFKKLMPITLKTILTKLRFSWVEEGGFLKSYVIFGVGMSKYLLFLTGVSG